MSALIPKLATTLRGYTRDQFLADLLAGVIVGIVALPLAIAFGIASGVTPARGLVTAIVAGFVISALGGSRVQIGGPTGAFVVIVAGIVERYGVDGLIVATMMAGVVLVALGLARLGSVIKFIPSSVVTGFTAGIAIVIFSSQIRDLFGLRMDVVPSEMVAKWTAYAQQAATVNVWAVGIGGLALLIIWLWPRTGLRLPGPFVALVVTTLLVQLLALPVETIGTRFGAVATQLPSPALPSVDWATLRQLAAPAFTIAMLAAIESLLSAVVADGMIGARHRSDMELIAQGIANFVTPVFGGIPATGAIARTATNVRNGGRTPIAGIVHAATLLVIVLFAGTLAARIPLAALAAILVVVSYHMSEWRAVRAELRGPRADALVLLLTLGLTVLVDLTVAVAVGLILAMFLFMQRMAAVTNLREYTADADEDEPGSGAELAGPVVPPGVALFEVSGPLFFGAAAQFRETLRVTGARKPKALVIRLRNVPLIDGTGVRLLHELAETMRRERIPLVLSELAEGPRRDLVRAGVLQELGARHVCDTVEEALAVAHAEIA